MNAVEAFFADYEKTIAALGAISTLAAVIVSLYLARKSESIRLRASVAVWTSVEGREITGKAIHVRVVNVGLRSAFIPAWFFHYKIPFAKNNIAITPAHNAVAFELLPGKSVLVNLQDLEVFHSSMQRVLSQDLKYLIGLRLRLMKGFIHTEGGESFRAKFEPSIKKEILNVANKLTERV